MSGAVSMYDGLESEAPPKNTTLSPPGGVGVESGGGGGGKAGGGGITKKLARGISRATENAAIVSHARSQLTFLGIVDTPEFTFSLPDLSIYPGNYYSKYINKINDYITNNINNNNNSVDSFRQFLEKDLIEGGCLTSLESAGRLNWWCGGGGRNSNSGRVLWPLATTGDGNCLLHAASLGMWGFHDRLLTLRDALHNTLSKGEYKDPLFRRWKWRQMGLNAAAGLAYTETEWLTEWQSIVEMASANPRSQTATSYQSLEEVYI